MTDPKRDLVRRNMEQLGYLYTDSGREAASSISGAAEFIGGAIVALLWACAGALLCGVIFGDNGWAFGFWAVLLGFIWPGIGGFVLTLAVSAFPGALIAALLVWLIGGPFMVWWLFATLGVIVVGWAKTVTAPEQPAPSAAPPSPLGNARFANPADVRATNGIDYQ
jgi:hypothetical protein